MKKNFAWIVVFLVAYILQTSLLNLISFHNVSADLLLLLTVSYSLTHGFRRGAFVGFCSGLLQDVASGTFLGFNALSKMVIGFGFGFMLGRVYEKKFILPLLSSILATAVNYLISLLVILMLGYRVNMLHSLYNLLLIPLIYNLCFSYVVHRIVCWLKNKSFDD
ncbi:rod shape-determining protein MreD [Pectinatus cerevisiiphilus]|uniref:Rod shape-determining protein MreD n=1 Tax=Pectinatus cerevisiiphilus TaxID=86956 RepID=A0A4R3KEU4_9FIRM|nr:rod shape-determining protein MreD [Pectinatus cerevisiiphilus]TCS81489.1 rod shape-determining protein MreD [Pectinatus cerevisiiphilus]